MTFTPPREPAILATALAVVAILATAAAAPDGADDAPPDWHLLDWTLDRAVLVGRYLFTDTQPDDPWADYLQTLSTSARPAAATVAAWAGVDPVERAQRRRQAAALRERAARGMIDAISTLRGEIERGARLGMTDALHGTAGFGEAITGTLRRLDEAAALDPSDPRIWADLAFFSHLAGDVGRSERSQLGYLAAWRALDDDERARLAARHAEFVLERAWFLRDQGRHEECLQWLADHAESLASRAERPRLAPATEAVLIRALVHADRGETTLAHGLLPRLPELDLPSRTGAPLRTYVRVNDQRAAYTRRFLPGEPSAVGASSERWSNDATLLGAREHRTSDALRRWVRGWTELRRGHEPASVMRALGRPMTELVFPPRLAWRWWQDQGSIYEQIGEVGLARDCWARAAIARPLFIYEPFGQGRGVSRVHDLAGTGEPYFLAYGTFFVAGSRWSYAANAALASEVEDTPLAQATLRTEAMAHLDACVRRRIFPGRARALRGRLRFLSEDYAAAEADLRAAWDTLEPAGEAPADLALMIGLCGFNAQDWVAARPWLEAFVERQPNAHVGWQALALTLAQVGEPDAAVVAMDEAVALAPDNATYLFNRALLHYRAGARDRAAADLARARELWPENPQIARMVEVVAEPVQYDLQVDARPVHVDLPRRQRAELSGVLRGESPEAAGDLAGLVTLEEEGRAEVLASLERRFRDAPTAENRRRLAQGALLAGEPERTASLLSPLWPARLSPHGRQLLLEADRRSGEMARAVAIAGGLSWPDQDDEVDTLVLAAVILLDHDRRDLARPLVERALARQPERAELHQLQRRLATAP
jgi:tetratricopeptide (TPR) repeat protein